MALDFGQIRRRQDGRLYLDFGRTGKLYSAHGAPFRDEREAEHVLHAVRVAIARGVSRSRAVEQWMPAASAAHRVERWMALWVSRLRDLVAAGERSAAYLREIERYASSGGHVGAYWDLRSVHDVDYASLEHWSKWLAERGLAPKTRLNVMAALHAMLSWLRQIGEIDRVPPFPWPRVAEHAPRLLSVADQGRVLEAIAEDRRGIYLALALLGLRPSEAIRLRAADYAPGDPGWLTIARTKNGQVKRLPVPDVLAAWLSAHLPSDARLRGLPLFALPYSGRGHRPAGPWTATSLRRSWLDACRSVGVSASLYEGTKHSRATDLLRLGVSERVLQALLGHRDARSTRRYARLADEALVEAIAPRKIRP